MSRYLSYFIILYILNLSESSDVVYANSQPNLCAKCICWPDDKAALIVTCTSPSRENLLLTGGRIHHNLQNVTTMRFSNYHALSFERNAFSQIFDLQIIVISDVERVILPNNVFDTLTDLVVTNVEDLLLTSKAFLNQYNLKNIVFKNLTITNLPPYAFYNLTNINKFQIENSNIKRIESSAINVTFASDGNFEIINSVIDNADEHALTVVDGVTTFDKCNINNLPVHSVHLSQKNLKITNSYLNLFWGASINLASIDRIYFENNIFEIMDSDMLDMIFKNNTFVLKNNYVKDVDIVKLLNSIYSNKRTHVLDNTFNCKCYKNSNVWFQKFLLGIDGHMTCLMNNYCKSACNLTLFTYLTHVQKDENNCSDDNYLNKYCSRTIETTLKPSTSMTSTTMRQIFTNKLVNADDSSSQLKVPIVLIILISFIILEF